MEKLRLGYFADGPWSHKAFEMLIADASLEIAFIVPRSDTKDQTLKNFALQYGIDYIEHAKINSPQFLDAAKAYACDLFVSMSFNQIFRPATANLPRYKTINCHAGKLPFYRGRNILNWALINDEREFGITVHYIDEGIDTGDIILQRVFPIREEDTYKTLLEVSHTACAEILYDAIKLIQENRHEAVKQSTLHPVGFYCGVRGEGDELINWNQSSRDVFNFIRAVCDPGPRATCYCRGAVVKINSAELIPGAPVYKSTIGQVVGLRDNGFVIKTADATILIKEVEAEIKLRPGDRLTSVI